MMDRTPDRRPERALHIVPLAATMLGLAGCQGEDTFDRTSQIGPNPVLPKPKQYLLPPFKIAEPVGWRNNETPSVQRGPEDSGVRARPEAPADRVRPAERRRARRGAERPAAGTGDPPKDMVMSYLMSISARHDQRREPDHAAARRRRRRRAGGRTSFLDNLNSPFGMVLVGKRLLRRKHRCDRSLSIRSRATTRIDARGEADRSARRADQSPLDEKPHRESRRLASLCDGRLEQQCRRERHGGREGPRGNLGGRRARAGARLRDAASAIRTASRCSRRPARSGPWSTSATSSARISCPTTSHQCKMAVFTAGHTATTASTSIRG